MTRFSREYAARLYEGQAKEKILSGIDKSIKERKEKYHNKRVDGFDSVRERDRFNELHLLERTGHIRALRRQQKFLLIPKQDGERACTFIADFVYEERQPTFSNANYMAWREVVEDCKGMRTEVYRIKRKLMLFVHQIKIRET